MAQYFTRDIEVSCFVLFCTHRCTVCALVTAHTVITFFPIISSLQSLLKFSTDRV